MSGNRGWTQADDDTLVQLYAANQDDWGTIGYAMGRSDHAVRQRYKDGLKRGKWEIPVHDGSTSLDSGIQPRITSLDELLRQMKVDLSIWEVVEHTVNKWEVGAVLGDGVKKRVVVEPLYQVKARLKPIPGADNLKAIRDQALIDIEVKASAKAVRRVPPPSKKSAAYLLEMATVDLHVGKLAWAQETGEDYDISIAEDTHTKAVGDLMQKASGFAIERSLLLVGNDLLHIDSYEATTTKGTRQDADSRYPKMFRRARQLMCRTIDDLLGLGPVHVVVVPGNHDRVSAFTIGEVLEAWYRSHPHVTVDNSPKTRKYLEYGVNLLGFTHGSEEKMDNLPLLMAQEQRDAWARTTQHEWHIGHLHKMKERRYVAGDSFGGVRVRILPTLTAHDAWHYQQGYAGRRASEAYLWHKADGYAGHFSSNVAEKAVA